MDFLYKVSKLNARQNLLHVLNIKKKKIFLEQNSIKTCQTKACADTGKLHILFSPLF